MIYKYSPEKFWHRYPKDRTFLEKVARRFVFPRYDDRAMTFEGWDSFNARMKSSFPIRWFFNRTIPDLWTTRIQHPISDIKRFFRYRLTKRLHVVKTGLRPGYYDADQRMLHSAFSLLKDYVEIELAAMYAVSNDAGNNPGESSRSYYERLGRYKSKNERNPEAGLAYLDWEINDSDGSQVSFGGGTQGDIAREKKFLYLWWTQYRPQRLDLYKDPLIWSGEGYNPTISVFNQNCAFQYHLVGQLDEFYEAEDEEMLHRLIHIRKMMWT